MKAIFFEGACAVRHQGPKRGAKIDDVGKKDFDRADMGRRHNKRGGALDSRFVVISGCSGGGKSSLIDALAVLGHQTVPEPGRRIVAEEMARGGSALPWIDAAGFARRAVDMARADLARARDLEGMVFFDRGLIDAAAALAHVTDASVEQIVGDVRYHPTVFLTPPWPQIYVTDPERRHGLEAAIAEYERLAALYPALGYTVVTLPKTSVADRFGAVRNALKL